MNIQKYLPFSNIIRLQLYLVRSQAYYRYLVECIQYKWLCTCLHTCTTLSEFSNTKKIYILKHRSMKIISCVAIVQCHSTRGEVMNSGLQIHSLADSCAYNSTFIGTDCYNLYTIFSYRLIDMN
jgi:hypothetical protein